MKITKVGKGMFAFLSFIEKALIGMLHVIHQVKSLGSLAQKVTRGGALLLGKITQKKLRDKKNEDRLTDSTTLR